MMVLSKSSQEMGIVGEFDLPNRTEPFAQVCAVWQGRATFPQLSIGKPMLRVLVVDDIRDAADSLSMLVMMWGHSVSTAYSGAAAFEMASACRPDVLLVDIGMPRMNGYGLATRLRAEPRFDGVLLIATTGYADAAHRQFGMAAGFDHYLVKPVDLGVLETALSFESVRLTRPSAEAATTNGADGIKRYRSFLGQ